MRPWAALALGLVLLTFAWAALHLPAFDRYQIVDTPVYEDYGERMADGEVPYRDFEVEYPPASLPLFWLPTLAPEEHYASAFELLMWGCAAAAVGFVALALAGVGARPARLFAAAGFVGLAPLALGTVVLTRYDLWPAALTAAALAAFVREQGRLAFAALALAAAAKIYALVLLPLVLVYAWRRWRPREAWTGLGVFVAVLALVVGPFLVVAPAGLWQSVSGQLGRPLQIESLAAAVLLAAHRLGWYEPTVVSTHGSQNLAGGLPDALAVTQTVLQGLALVAVWALFARGRGGPERLLLASAAAVVAFVAFGKVLSPQFLIWLVPLVPLVAGGSGLAASAVLAAALVTTHLWFPTRYWDVVALEPAGWLVLVRDVLLVALLALLVAALARGRRLPGERGQTPLRERRGSATAFRSPARRC
ncbi:MAG: glycosyltransferase 87 family protein [Gaiellaceae bacterium]